MTGIAKVIINNPPELDPQGPSKGTKKVMRGGELTTSLVGEAVAQDEYYPSNGFRCAVQQTTTINSTK
ncbi:hypothetical protein VAS14_12824 [Photobacterium angustum S14]|uniref:Uncharacterized protein n=1 Tax=Photobacterium angustum (strain S14 / CCUG 15956) TaxID=314292 RepID=Q1ZV60_PHOAS|nr:hypothetical protein VAS14_12824 [Photobacterium angustum S14]